VEDKRNKLQQKYYVERIDERDRADGDRADSKYFVLDYVHDPYSMPALEAYAQACFKDFPDLSAEIRTLVQQLKNNPQTRS
jgi:predicted ester cyclase